MWMPRAAGLPRRLGQGQGAPRVTREAAMAKLFATEQAQQVIDKAVQLHGGDGVRSGHIVESSTAKSGRFGSMKAQRTCRKSSLHVRRWRFCRR
jgi:alkylation response protein AidB-like acyl-CoA dehydrogenase